MLTRQQNKKKRSGDNGSDLSEKSCKKRRIASKKTESANTTNDTDHVPGIPTKNLETDHEKLSRERVKDALIFCMAMDQSKLRDVTYPVVDVEVIPNLKAKKTYQSGTRHVSQASSSYPREKILQKREADALVSCKAIDDESVLMDFKNPLDDGEVNLQGECTMKKKIRGSNVFEVIGSNKRKRTQIITNNLGVPIGPNAQAFASDIGKAIKHLVPIKYKNWSEVPGDVVKRCWIFLDMIYVIPTTQPLLIRWIKERLKDCFSEYKSNLYHAISEKFESMDEMITNCPNHIPFDDWEAFIKYRNSAEFMEASKQCQEIMKKSKNLPVLGRKSFSQLEEELKAKGGPGYPVNRVDLWKEGYLIEKNTSAKHYMKLGKAIDERIASGSSVVTGKNDVVVESLGLDRRGRARAVGNVVLPGDVFDADDNQEKLHKCKVEVTKQKNRLEKDERRIETLENGISDLKTLLQKQLIMQQCAYLGNQKNEMTPSTKASRKPCHVLHGLELVANGEVVSSDPNYCYQSMPVGEGNCLIHVSYVHKPEMPLYRQTQFLRKMKDICGGYTIYPMKNIELLDTVGENKDMIEEVAEILSSGFKYKERFATLNYHKRSNIKVTSETLQCLNPRKWLRDDVIDLYFVLLKDREERAGISPNMLRCHYFNTQFYRKLLNEQNEYDYQAVEGWTEQKKIGYYLANCRLIFVPVNIDHHWSLGVIDLKRRKIMHLDSMGRLNDHIIDNLTRYIVDELKNKNYMETDLDDWVKDTVECFPIQNNTWDCGMYILKYSEYLSRGVTTLDFGQDDINRFRYIVRDQLLRLVVE